MYSTFYAFVVRNVTACKAFVTIFIPDDVRHGNETDPSGAFATSAGKDTVVEFTEKNSTL